ncbi:TPA: hypothetical protein DEG21_02455 [Patescibacteria group bacterium]|nr:hypothetical protein [Candidatus Gracilibacteria bacterium]HBY74739.1 hypothetical protein [Candidatus Gracilibacteria bacterium]
MFIFKISFIFLNFSTSLLNSANLSSFGINILFHFFTIMFFHFFSNSTPKILLIIIKSSKLVNPQLFATTEILSHSLIS